MDHNPCNRNLNLQDLVLIYCIKFHRYVIEKILGHRNLNELVFQKLRRISIVFAKNALFNNLNNCLQK